MVAVAVAVLVSAVAVDLTFVPRRLALGAPIEAVTGVVWSDRAALLWFTIFVGTAVAMRRSAQTHKRLMLMASISIIQPALARIALGHAGTSLPTGPVSRRAPSSAAKRSDC